MAHLVSRGKRQVAKGCGASSITPHPWSPERDGVAVRQGTAGDRAPRPRAEVVRTIRVPQVVGKLDSQLSDNPSSLRVASGKVRNQRLSRMSGRRWLGRTGAAEERQQGGDGKQPKLEGAGPLEERPRTAVRGPAARPAAVDHGLRRVHDGRRPGHTVGRSRVSAIVAGEAAVTRGARASSAWTRLATDTSHREPCHDWPALGLACKSGAGLSGAQDLPRSRGRLGAEPLRRGGGAGEAGHVRFAAWSALGASPRSARDRAVLRMAFRGHDPTSSVWGPEIGIVSPETACSSI
jgi:hypothetical protein